MNPVTNLTAAGRQDAPSRSPEGNENMAEETPAVEDVRRPAADEGKPPEYDAFLSYAHQDKAVTTAIQKGLHQIGRRMGQLRALRVFRDDTNLTANPDLWGKITEALDGSRFMIVVLSPQAASSHWVNEEVSYWLQHRGRAQLMLVLAQGHLAWDEKNRTFDPEHSDAAPPVLTEPGSLRAEPLYIDVSDDAPWDLRSLMFRDKVTALAAPIHGKPKDQLAGDDLREQRRFRRLRAGAVTGLAVLTVVAVVAAVIAVAQRQEAIRRLHDAVVAKLNAEGAAMLAGARPGGDVRALQELLAAYAIANPPDGVPILDAQIARFTTQKIIDLGATSPALAYRPDGHRIVTGQSDGSLRQWDSATGKPVGAPMKGHTALVTAVAYTPDGQTIASASDDGTMRLWNAATGTALNPNPQHVHFLHAIAVSPDGKVIITGDANDTIQEWDPHSGQLLTSVQAFSDHTASIGGVTFDRRGRLFAAGATNGSVAIIDPATGLPHAPIIVIKPQAAGPTPPIYRIESSPDGHMIAIGTENLQLWNADTGTLIRTIQLETRQTAVFGVAFSPDGQRIATGRADGALQLWDTDTGTQLGQALIGHAGPVTGLAFSPDGRQIATVSHDGTLRLWSATVGQPMRGPDPELWHVAFSPHGQRVAATAASGGRLLEQWDVGSGQPQPPLTVGGWGGKEFAYVGSGRIVTAAADGTVQVWDANTGQPLQPPVHINIAPAEVGAFAFSSDGRMVASGRLDDGTVALWDVATGRERGQPMTADFSNESVYGLAFSPDGHRLVASYNEGLRLWNTDTTQPDGTAMTDGGTENPVTAVAFSRDGTTVAAGREDGAVELWNPDTRKQLPDSPLRGHTGMVRSVAFGVAHQLASGGIDGTVRLWDTATGQPAAAPQTGPDVITSVAVSPDGRLAAQSSLDGAVRLSPAIADPSQLCDKLSTNMSYKQWRDWVSPGIGYITVCPGLPIAPD
jgi:WD40 repeat protein